MFLVTVTSPSILSNSLHNRSSSWFTEDATFVSDNVEDRARQSQARVCGVCVDSRRWLWISLCRYWGGHFPAGLSAEWRSAWRQGYQSPSRSPGWLTTGQSPGCAGETHRISNQSTTWLYLSAQPFRTANICTVTGTISTCWTLSPLPFHLKCYLLSVQLLNLLFLCPQDFIQLTHPAEFSLAREKIRCDSSFHVQTIIMSSRTALDLRRHPFLLADMCRHIPCSHLDPTVWGENGN